MLKALVLQIGEEARFLNQSLLVLHNQTASKQLQQVAIIQDSTAFQKEDYALQLGSKIFFDDQEYTVTAIGPLVKDFLVDLGQVTLNFKEGLEIQPNMISLSPATLPDIQVGTEIRYE